MKLFFTIAGAVLLALAIAGGTVAYVQARDQATKLENQSVRLIEDACEKMYLPGLKAETEDERAQARANIERSIVDLKKMKLSPRAKALADQLRRDLSTP